MHDFDSSIIEYLKAEKGLNDKQIEDFSREYATLTDAERSYVIYEVVGKALYKEYPVDIDTFIFDPYNIELINILRNNINPYNALKHKYGHVFDYAQITNTSDLYYQLIEHNNEYIYHTYKKIPIDVARPNKL